MAWRIHDSVQRGEIDNRERGIVRGKIWLEGMDGPVALELSGNAAPDLAGCLLSFENPGKALPMPKDAHFRGVQSGTIGDLTASRKVRVLDMPVTEIHDGFSVETAGNWDSIHHLNLVMALEDAFGVSFSSSEITGLQSYRAIEQALAARRVV